MAKEETTSLATATSSALASDMDEIFDGFDFDVDGIGEAEKGDIILPLKVFNMKGKDKNTGRAIPKDVFFDTLTEETVETLRAVLLLAFKTHEWREWDNDTDRSVIHCRSQDRVVGRAADGRERKCKGCPDFEWREVDGKRVPRCGEVLHFFGVDLDTEEPFILRCKKTSYTPAQRYLSAHFRKKLVTKAGRTNLPLFSVETRIRLQMSDNGNYAIPVFEKGPMFERKQIFAYQDMVKFYTELMHTSDIDKISSSDVDEDAHASDKPNPNDFRDDFVEDAEFTESVGGGQAELRDF